MHKVAQQVFQLFPKLHFDQGVEETKTLSAFPISYLYLWVLSSLQSLNQARFR